jgi:hypothetical protein
VEACAAGQTAATPKAKSTQPAAGAGAALLLQVCQQQHPLVTDGNEMGVNSEFLFLLFMYEIIKYETTNPVEQIWEVFIWCFCYTLKKAGANLEAGEAEQSPSFRLCCVYQNN